MKLYHVSPNRIRGTIRVDRCRTKIRCVWLCTVSRIGWALSHLRTCHKTATEWHVYEVDVKRSNVRRRRRGIWMHFGDVAITQRKRP